MPKVNKLPEKLRPYDFHGIAFTGEQGKNAVADCPFCGGYKKFSVVIDTGVSKCWKEECTWAVEGSKDAGKQGGNFYVFMRAIYQVSEKSTKAEDCLKLSEDRRLQATTLLRWGVVRSIGTGDWLVPGYDAEGKLMQLYKYVQGSKRTLLLPTPTLKAQLFGMNLYDPEKFSVYVCEGPWDGMALWEALGGVKESENGLSLTSNESKSLLADSSVVAVPGLGSIGKPFERWVGLFKNKSVALLFDNDHPKRNRSTKELMPANNFRAVQRAVRILDKTETKPTSVNWLYWGPEGWDKNYADGYDIRDWLCNKNSLIANNRVANLESLIARINSVPGGWFKPQTADYKTQSPGTIEPVPCSEYRTMIMAWRKALKWTDGLDRALAAMLASITSVKIVGDQLWLKIIGPAACGKSTLCEAVSINKQYIVAKSSIRGFHSGYKTDKDGSEDSSLISLLRDKTLVTKDGDSLLTAPNRDQILGEARDLYDRVSRTHYRNRMSKDYDGVCMTWLLCGTSSLRQLDDSELGERFLDCVIMDRIDGELEDDILLRVANRADRNMSLESDGKAETYYEPELIAAYGLTGGYVSYLRENAADLLSGITLPSENKSRCIDLGKFVAYMRARPSRKQQETAERELASRLVSQHIRLAKCLAVVLNRSTVDGEVMRRVRCIALDTARGQTLDIAGELYKSNLGLQLGTVARYLNRSDWEIRRLLRFLRQIGAVETFEAKRVGLNGIVRWRLTRVVHDLYKKVRDA